MTRGRYLRAQRKALQQITLYAAVEYHTDELYRILTSAMKIGWPSGVYACLCDDVCSFGAGFGGVFYRRQLFKAVRYLKAVRYDMRHIDPTRAAGFWLWSPP